MDSVATRGNWCSGKNVELLSRFIRSDFIFEPEMTFAELESHMNSSGRDKVASVFSRVTEMHLSTIAKDVEIKFSACVDFVSQHPTSTLPSDSLPVF